MISSSKVKQNICLFLILSGLFLMAGCFKKKAEIKAPLLHIEQQFSTPKGKADLDVTIRYKPFSGMASNGYKFGKYFFTVKVSPQQFSPNGLALFFYDKDYDLLSNSAKTPHLIFNPQKDLKGYPIEVTHRYVKDGANILKGFFSEQSITRENFMRIHTVEMMYSDWEKKYRYEDIDKSLEKGNLKIIKTEIKKELIKF